MYLKRACVQKPNGCSLPPIRATAETPPVRGQKRLAAAILSAEPSPRTPKFDAAPGCSLQSEK